MKYPSSIENLIEALTALPSVGRKTAERYVFYLLRKNQAELDRFAQSFLHLKDKITFCKTCMAISETDPCSICADAKRDRSMVCIVAGYRDMITVEATGQYNGVYYILGGTIDVIKGIKPEQLNTQTLMQKIKSGSVREIILALNPDLEGETTSMYLNKLIKTTDPKIKITRIAKGLPMGADLEYADDMTISNALKYRNEI